MRSLGFGSAANSVGTRRSLASRNFVAVVLGGSAFGAVVLKLAVGVAASGFVEVTIARIALLAEFDSSVTANGRKGDRGSAGVGGSGGSSSGSGDG